MKITPKLTFILEAFYLEQLGIPEWESHQLGFFNSEDLFTIDNKSRQIGWSYGAAVDALAECSIKSNVTAIFLSINQDEANNKIRYVTQAYEALKDKWKIPAELKKTEVEFSNGSRIKSLPCKAPRGYAQPIVYVDEFAHYPQDDIVYQGLVATITRGGKIRIGSSPLGTLGLFYDIFSSTTSGYANYVRRAIPWWTVEGLCTNVKEAIKLAPNMHTPDRVDKYATERLKSIFENYTLEDFQQEYECNFLDDTVAWISWDLIKRCQEHFMLHPEEFCIVKEYNEYQEEKIDEDIADLRKAIDDGKVGGVCYIGQDTGRHHNKSEIFILSEENSGLISRANLTLNKFEFRKQKEIITRICDILPVDGYLIDETGLGMQLAEESEALVPEVEGVTFTHGAKRDISVNLKKKMESGKLAIPIDKSISREIHSIQQKVTSSNNVIYQAKRSKLHHGDKYWALGLAVMASNYSSDQIASSPFSNYRGNRYG